MWITILARYWWAVAIAILGLAVSVQTHRLNAAKADLVSLQARYDVFVEGVRQAGEAQIAKNKEKEQQNAKTLNSAVASRDDALRRLRESESRPRGGFVSVPAAGSGGDSKICYDRQAVDAALRRFDAGTAGLIAEGDKAIIDSAALVSAWPK